MKEQMKFWLHFIPEAEAVERLVDLIKEHNKWVKPEAMPEKALTG
jgi:hypothetical protein